MIYKNAAIFCVSLILLISCKKHAPPKTELCTARANDDSLILCNDSRRPNGSQDYDRFIKLNDFCTNSADFNRLRDYCGDLRVKLIECESR